MNDSRPLLGSGIRVLLLIAVVVGGVLFIFVPGGLSPGTVTFSQSSADLDAYDFVEVSAHVSGRRARNPFTDATLFGTFEKADGTQKWRVDGFSDAADGSVYRIRFMPRISGDYTYEVQYRQGLSRKTFAENSTRGAAAVAAPFEWTPKTAGTLFGKARASTTSLMAPPRIG